MTIKARHPVREDFAGCSSGKYYATKGAGIGSFDDALGWHGLHLADCTDWHGSEGRRDVEILDENDEVVGRAIFTYYEMNSGRWEIIGYIA